MSHGQARRTGVKAERARAYTDEGPGSQLWARKFPRASFCEPKSLDARAVSLLPLLIAFLDKHSAQKEKAAIYFSIFRNSCGCLKCEAFIVKFYTLLWIWPSNLTLRLLIDV
jgi:hypothetical protein